MYAKEIKASEHSAIFRQLGETSDTLTGDSELVLSSQNPIYIKNLTNYTGQILKCVNNQESKRKRGELVGDKNAKLSTQCMQSSSLINS